MTAAVHKHGSVLDFVRLPRAQMDRFRSRHRARLPTRPRARDRTRRGDKRPDRARSPIRSREIRVSAKTDGIFFFRGHRRSRAPVRAIATLGWVYGQAGRDADATAMAERLNALATERHVSPMHHAVAAIGTGDHDLALTHLHAAVTERDGGLPFIGVSPLYDPLAEDPRFIELLTTIGLR